MARPRLGRFNFPSEHLVHDMFGCSCPGPGWPIMRNNGPPVFATAILRRSTARADLTANVHHCRPRSA